MTDVVDLAARRAERVGTPDSAGTTPIPWSADPLPPLTSIDPAVARALWAGLRTIPLDDDVPGRHDEFGTGD